MRRGPLLYALGISGIRQPIKDYPVPGFHDYTVSPVTWGHARFALINMTGAPGPAFQLVPNPKADARYPWDAPPLLLEGTLMNLDSMKAEPVALVPMGSDAATLRRMTFPATP